MVKKCKGLPLAAKTLGGLVRFKVCDSEWEDVLNSDIWDLPDEKSDILPFLRLSYHYLPAHLKRCFAYCSIFPKGFKFDRDRLVLLWMAEGLVQQPRRKKRMEEVGEDYFKDLLSRSFFQQCSSDAHFIMHDLINDLAQFVSGEFCFRLEDHKQKEISSRIRHLSYTRSEYDAVNKFEAFKAIKFLRTFMPLNLPHNVQVCHLTSQVPHYLLPALQCLRVLSLSHYGITELPDSIGDLKFLRYMDLSYTGVKELPKSATTLYNLQTLILLQCHSLTKLPTDFENLTNLHYFDITGSELTMMPGQIGRLKSLEKLPTFIVGTNSGSAMKELGKLLLLRGTLSIEGLQNVIDVRDAKEANLKDKKFIDELTLEWSSKIDGPRNGTVEDNVLDKLQPHKNLKRIDIRNYGGSRFPKWLGDHSFSKMASVSLKSLKNCISLPPLGNLPFLKNLSIEEMNGVKSVGPEFYGDASSLVKPFQSLETLRFENMPQWAEWMTSQVIEDDGFPCLQELYLRRCPILRGQLPISCPSLTKLVIYECTELDSPLPRFPSLKILEIHGCGQGVMTTARSFTSLSSLHINKISDLACVPESFLQQFTAMEDLSIGGCSEITSLSNRIGFQHLTSLNQLEIYGCLKLMNLPNELHSLPCLVHMRIEGCPSLLSLQAMGLPSTLKHLTIEECRALKSLPEGLLHNGDLEHLCIRYCSSLTSFPRGLVSSRGSTSTTTKLKSLMIEECENLLSLPDGIHNLTSLQELRLYECSRVLTFPEGGFPTKLRSLWIESCDDLMCLPMLMHNLSSLQELYIKGCPSITVFPDGGLPSSVESLQIVHCENLMRCIGMELEGLTSLRSFSIRGCRGVTSFPGDWVLPATLTSLCISKLPDLRAMSEGLQHLTSLEKLKIRECQELMSLPNRKLPDSLSFLEIWKCPRLDQRCLMEKGEDWPKIAHIPCIKSNYNVIL